MRAAPYLYAISLPERTLRSLSAITAGALKEATEFALPASVRQSALYRATAGVGFRFFIQHVGAVRGLYPRQDHLSRQFVHRYAVGTSIEMASIVTIYLSPVWVLAALGDAAKAGKTLFSEIAGALKAEGLLASDAKIETMLQLLDGLEATSSHLALTVNMPPLDVPAMRNEWQQFRANLAKFPSASLPSAAEVEVAWKNLRSTSRKLNQSVFRVSAAMGISAISSIPENLMWLSRSTIVATRKSGQVVGGAFLQHYAAASQELKTKGFAAYSRAHFRPYLVAAVRNFLPEKPSATERLFSYYFR
jgi:hypothetical protein